MLTFWQRTHLVVAIILLLGLGVGTQENPALAAPPTTDVLNGQRQLLRTDDVVWTLTFTHPPTGSSVNVAVVPGAAQTQGGNFKLEGGELFEPLENTGVDTSTDAIGLTTATAVGRMFNRPNDVIATLGVLNAQLLLTVIDAPSGTSVTSTALPLPVAAASFDTKIAENFSAAIMADFTGDGYAELLIVSTDIDGNSGMLVVSASDVNNINAGVTIGPALSLSNAYVGSATVGDFDGDGMPEIAALLGQAGEGSTVQFFAFDPKSFQITPTATLSLPNPLGVPGGAVAAGRFRDTTHDDLVAVGPSGDTNAITVYSISLDQPTSPQVVATTTIPLPASAPGSTVLWVKARSGRLDWSGSLDQLVLGVAVHGELVGIAVDFGQIIIATFDQNLNPTVQNQANPGEGCLYDLALGNFDQQNTDGTRNPNLQVATLWSPGEACKGFPFSDFPATSMNALIWSVDPNASFALTGVSATVVAPADPNDGSVTGSNSQLLAFGFAVGDTQGRSVMVGPPEVVTISNILQPEFGLAIPPMHIDYIRDKDNLGSEGQPAVLNLTAIPSLPAPAVGFSTQFNFGSSETGSASRKTTTSWGLATKFTNDEKASFGVPDVGSLSVEVKTSVGFTHDSTVATQYNTYGSTSDSLSATTGFADHLFFTAYNQNIFYYPVIGHTVCPSGQTTCPDSAKLPLYVQFSVPDTPSHLDIDATTQAWYQPVHEPGNLFSYPWDETQLKLALPSTWVPLTATGDAAPWRGTDTSTSAYETKWTASSGATQTSGSVNAQSFSLSICTSGSIGVSGLDANFSNTYDLNQSFSVSSLNVSTQTQEASEGVKVNKPEFSGDVATTYLYSFAGYVFGLKSPVESLQTIELEDSSNQSIAIQSTGPMLAGFLADPFQASAGVWWQQAYALPDVGLNHPSRWDWAKSTQTATFNCADGTNSQSCTTATSNDPLLTDFYRMKGFFITPADANGNGPSRSVATAGDQLTLTARIYNYSLVDTHDPSLSHPAATIKVRFYGQLFEDGQLQGQAFLIGQDEIGFITGFKSVNTGPGGANWTVANVPFDTGGTNCGGQSCAAKSLVFWVVVWMEDANGNLVPEIEGHGLTANPGAMTLAQITDVPIEAYSNNVGLYGMDSQFAILPPPNTANATPVAAVSAPGSLTVEDFSVPVQPLLLDDKVRLTAQLHSDETRAGPVVVAYYEGDPQHGGKLFDVHHIAHLAPDATSHTKAEYRPQSCGEHTLVMVADPASGTPATARASVQVTIIPADLVEALITATKRLALPDGAEAKLLGRLVAARQAFQHHFDRVGANRLKSFIGEVEAQRGVTLTNQQADRLISQARVILGCV